MFEFRWATDVLALFTLQDHFNYMVSRRSFLETLVSSAGLCSWAYGRERLRETLAGNSSSQFRKSKFDRAALVSRHNPRVVRLDPLSPLTLGNGEFAFTSDITGLQTLPQEYKKATPLCTMSQWGWHTRPSPIGLDTKGLRLTQYNTHGRQVGYQTSSEGQTELYNWLRENPHRLHLGQIGLCRTAGQKREIQVGDLSDIKQELDLWRGILTSNFKFEGEAVTIRTAVHPSLDLLAVSIESRLIDDGRLAFGARVALWNLLTAKIRVLLSWNAA